MTQLQEVPLTVWIWFFAVVASFRTAMRQRCTTLMSDCIGAYIDTVFVNFPSWEKSCNMVVSSTRARLAAMGKEAAGFSKEFVRSMISSSPAPQNNDDIALLAEAEREYEVAWEAFVNDAVNSIDRMFLELPSSQVDMEIVGRVVATTLWMHVQHAFAGEHKRWSRRIMDCIKASPCESYDGWKSVLCSMPHAFSGNVA